MTFNTSTVDTLETKLLVVPGWLWGRKGEAALPVPSLMETLSQIQASCGQARSRPGGVQECQQWATLPRLQSLISRSGHRLPGTLLNISDLHISGQYIPFGYRSAWGYLGTLSGISASFETREAVQWKEREMIFLKYVLRTKLSTFTHISHLNPHNTLKRYFPYLATKEIEAQIGPWLPVSVRTNTESRLI